ncbi:MAG: hypothetical protein ABIJ09_12240 [Pseudomonadota bacterium]
MSDTSSQPSARNYLVAAAILLILPAASFVIGRLNTPRPMSLVKTRAAVDRDGLKGTVLLDALPSTVQQPMTANLEDKIEVLGLSVDKPSALQGERVEFTYYFRALSDIDEDWQIFGHIDGINNVYRIHADHYPVNGNYTTDLWLKGEIVADTYVKYIPLDAPSGRYDVWIGFYIGDSRLKLKNPDKVTTDGSNRVKVGQFTVGSP